MALPAVLTYLQTAIAAAGLPIDAIVLAPAPRRISMMAENVSTLLYIWPRDQHEDRGQDGTMAGKHGYRHIHYDPMDFVLRSTTAADLNGWLPFTRVVAAMQAFLRTQGDLTPIAVADAVTSEGTYLTHVGEVGRIAYAYAPVLRQDAPVTVQATLGAVVIEQMQGPGVIAV